MTGHFEQGRWIGDPEPSPEPMVVKVKIEVDDSRLKAVMADLERLALLLQQFRE